MIFKTPVFPPLFAEEAEAQKAKGEAVILCRQETSPEDVGGMHAAEGILTSRGGMTSHAAVVARGWGKPCCCGCEELIVDAFAKTLKAPVSTFCGCTAGVTSLLVS
jgi:pyruvate,orthophosphate dikinase